MHACRAIQTADALEGKMTDLRAMIVEDYPQIRTLIRSILKDFGNPVVEEAASVQEAVAALPHFEPDVLLVDWHLSRGDGLALTKLVRDRERSCNPYMPILMITAFATPEKIGSARDAGVTAFVRKPFTADTLARHIRAVIDDERPFINAPRYFGPDRRHRKVDHTGRERRTAGAGREVEVVRTKFNGERYSVVEILPA